MAIRRTIREIMNKSLAQREPLVEEFPNVTSFTYYLRDKTIRMFTTKPGVVIDRHCDFISRELGVIPKFRITDFLVDAASQKITVAFEPPIKVRYVPWSCWLVEMK